ncbi:hypothetical protein [Hymenobacter sp. NBH84]|uniref:hypothetical protein n=1 Tax=Hymenobacter sp. NBH84 TaxID=2596915 RepID=UPI0021562226|nr:hypothetical protein [Hymenobacter sp. NBH84]
MSGHNVGQQLDGHHGKHHPGGEVQNGAANGRPGWAQHGHNGPHDHDGGGHQGIQ